MAERKVENWESNYQFDFPPLKVRNHPELFACRWCVTYRWKAFDKSYNFSLNFTLIKCLIKKSYGFPKLPESQFQEFQDSQLLKSLETKWHLGVGLVNKHKYYYKGESGGFPKSELWWVLWIHVCLWFVCVPKVLQSHNNQFVVWFVWIIDSLFIRCSPHPKMPTEPSTPKVL